MSALDDESGRPARSDREHDRPEDRPVRLTRRQRDSAGHRHVAGPDQGAYGIDQIPANTDGSGQTIAIVIAYDAPTIAQDVNTFSTQYNLPLMDGQNGDPTITKVNQTGGSTLPPVNAGWAQETSIDVEWAHAIAPKANILVVEANSNSLGDLMAAVRYAAQQHPDVVSMSWGGGEFSSETQFNSSFNA